VGAHDLAEIIRRHLLVGCRTNNSCGQGTVVVIKEAFQEVPHRPEGGRNASRQATVLAPKPNELIKGGGDCEKL